MFMEEELKVRERKKYRTRFSMKLPIATEFIPLDIEAPADPIAAPVARELIWRITGIHLFR